MTAINTEFETMEFRVQPPEQRERKGIDIKRLFAKLWSLQYPKRYREDFMYCWEQWRYTDWPESGLWWACQVFGEYVYPGWTYSDEEREILEQQRTARQEAQA